MCPSACPALGPSWLLVLAGSFFLSTARPHWSSESTWEGSLGVRGSPRLQGKHPAFKKVKAILLPFDCTPSDTYLPNPWRPRIGRPCSLFFLARRSLLEDKACCMNTTITGLVLLGRLRRYVINPGNRYLIELTGISIQENTIHGFITYCLMIIGAYFEYTATLELLSTCVNISNILSGIVSTSPSLSPILTWQLRSRILPNYVVFCCSSSATFYGLPSRVGLYPAPGTGMGRGGLCEDLCGRVLARNGVEVPSEDEKRRLLLQR